MKAKILLVEDEAPNLRVLIDYLRQADPEYKLLKAKNGKVAYAIVQDEKPDLIITDWRMPIMSGLELIKLLKSTPEYREIPIIMQTANTQDVELKESFDAGAMDYIKKPVSQLELLSRVRSALALNNARKRTEELLLHILPKEVAEELKDNRDTEPKLYEMVSILFTDFKGFTNIASKMTPKQLVNELNDCFDVFDDICSKYNLEKIKTMGDAYMAAGGLPIPNQTNPIDCVRAGLEMQTFVNQRYIERGGEYWQCRLGINTGEVEAGIIGKTKFAYDVWGDTVNLASRMESNGVVGKVQVSEVTYQLTKEYFIFSDARKIDAKGKGIVNAYFVESII